MQGDCLCSPPAFLYTTSYTIFICCEGVNYNVLILLVCIVTSIPMLRLSNRVGKFWYTVGAERAEGLRKCNRLKELLVEYNNIKEIKLFDIGDMLKNRVVRQQTDYVNSNKHYYKPVVKQMLQEINTVIRVISCH